MVAKSKRLQSKSKATKSLAPGKDSMITPAKIRALLHKKGTRIQMVWAFRSHPYLNLKREVIGCDKTSCEFSNHAWMPFPKDSEIHVLSDTMFQILDHNGRRAFEYIIEEGF